MGATPKLSFSSLRPSPRSTRVFWSTLAVLRSCNACCQPWVQFIGCLYAHDASIILCQFVQIEGPRLCSIIAGILLPRSVHRVVDVRGAALAVDNSTHSQATQQAPSALVERAGSGSASSGFGRYTDAWKSYPIEGPWHNGIQTLAGTPIHPRASSNNLLHPVLTSDRCTTSRDFVLWFVLRVRSVPGEGEHSASPVLGTTKPRRTMPIDGARLAAIRMQAYRTFRCQ